MFEKHQLKAYKRLFNIYSEVPAGAGPRTRRRFAICGSAAPNLKIGRLGER